MDLTAIITAVVTGLCSIGAITVFLKKYMPAVAKWAMIAKDAVETLSDLADALKDGVLSVDEMKKLQDDVTHFKQLLSS